VIGSFVFSETSPAAAGTAVSSQSVQSSSLGGIAWPVDDWEALDVAAEIQGATGGSLDVYLQGSPDSGANWYDMIHWATASGGGSLKYYKSPLSLATTTTAPTQVGKNLSPALAAGTVINGAFTDRLRLAMVAGSGTSAGAAVIVRVGPQRPRSNIP